MGYDRFELKLNIFGVKYAMICIGVYRYIILDLTQFESIYMLYY
jgi:hypothetical protein